MAYHKPIEELLLQMGFTPGDFNWVRKAHTRIEAITRLEALKARFKPIFKKKVLELHPDRTHGDLEKSKQLKLLVDFARDLENLRIPEEIPRVIVHEVTFHKSLRPRNLRVKIRPITTSAASILAGMRPSRC